MRIEGSYSVRHLVGTTLKVALPLALLSDGALWGFRLASPGSLHLLYAKIGYVLSAISIFIAFRVNQAYGRWWEARQLWGKLINESRTWGRLATTYFDPSLPLRRTLVMRQIAYVNVLRIALRHGTGDEGRTMMRAELKRLLPEGWRASGLVAVWPSGACSAIIARCGSGGLGLVVNHCPARAAVGKYLGAGRVTP